MRGASEPAQVQAARVSGLPARIMLASGETRTVKLEGVGCSVSICSRTAFATTRLDTIAAIKETTGDDALLVLRNGSERRISLLNDFRVLYFTSSSEAAEKLDLAKLKSIEFLPLPR